MPPVYREEWSAAHAKLLEREQELGRLDEELEKQRKELPWVPVEKEYRFQTDEGTKTLAEIGRASCRERVYSNV